jgi:hypothetical protein
LSVLREIRVEPDRLRQTTPKEYATRFLFGGTISAVINVLARAAGPVTAGLFLAIPAVLPASLTLIESKEGKRPAGRGAFGAAIGSIGLMAFALIVWTFATRAPAWIVLVPAALAWIVVSTVVWMISEMIAQKLGQ